MKTKTPSLPFMVKNSKFSPFSLKKTTNKEEDDIEEDKRRTMFYSQCLLSSKGPLNTIWVAGYFFKRLKKRQISDTDISSSVDKILVEGLPSITYRILAYLLLGVVKIYSKKVEYLFQDCHETVSDINRFSVGKKVTPFRDIVRSSYSIILPEKYELDSFTLEVADTASRANIAQNKDICLRVDAGKDVLLQYSLDTQCFEEDSISWEELHDDHNDDHTSHGITAHQATCSSIQTPVKTAVEQETSTLAHTPPDLALSPRPIEIDVEVSSPEQKKNFETSKERLRELKFPQEESMDVDRICELDVELINLVNDYQEQIIDNRDEDGLKKEPLEKECDLSNVKEVPVLVEKTTHEVSDAQAAATPEFVVIPTPAKKEKFQRPRKRKCMFDEATVLDNVIMKLAIKDASSLVCKRKKAPHTVIDLWRFHRIPSLSKIFVEPLIPYVGLELDHVHCKKMTNRTGPSTFQAVEPIQITQTPRKQQDAVIPSTPVESSRSTIAPGTPVQCPASARVFGSARAADSDGEGGQFARAHDNLKELSVHLEENYGLNLMAEMDATEGDSQEVHKNKNEEGLSGRSRIVAQYLRRVIQRKKQQGVEAVRLLPIVERKTKRENAMLFFEILVLSTGGLINVMQERAYGDVLLQETPELDTTLKKC